MIGTYTDINNHTHSDVTLYIDSFYKGYNANVGRLERQNNPDCHDRLIVPDYGEGTELVYHCGASSKDAGKKLCAINQITETAIIHPVIDRLLLLPDKQI